MKLAAVILFLVTGLAIFWQCSDMIPALRSSGAGPAVMVILWLPTVGLLISGLVAFANLRASTITGGVCLLFITGFYTLTLFSIESLSLARDWSYLVPLSGIVASSVFIGRQLTKRKPYT